MRALLIFVLLGLALPAPAGAHAHHHHHHRHHHHHARAHRADDELGPLTEEEETELIAEIQQLRQECLAEGIETQEWCENIG